MILFAAIRVALSIITLGVDLLAFGSVNILAFTHMIIASIFVWIAGTLPVQAVKPSLNVASNKDVR
jgi:hypothetical protein